MEDVSGKEIESVLYELVKEIVVVGKGKDSSPAKETVSAEEPPHDDRKKQKRTKIRKKVCKFDFIIAPIFKMYP